MNKFLRGCMSVASGLSLGIILMGCESLMRAMVHYARHRYANLDFDRVMPPLTKALMAFLPEGEISRTSAWLAFTIGCGWLSWQERPGALATTSRMLIGFALVGSFVAYLPLHQQTQCLCGENGDSSLDEFTWLLLCSLPLLAAIIKHRQSKSAGRSTAD